MRTEVVVIGGGLSGLAAAALLSRAGKQVVVVEKAHRVGGRARSKRVGGAIFNLGPHALYQGGHAERILRDLGVAFTGGSPSATGALGLSRGKLHALPGGLVTLLTSSLLGPAAKFELSRALARLNFVSSALLANVTVQQWLEQSFRHSATRELLAALIRVSSYTHAPHLLSAGAALEQFKMALSHGVCYIDGGWQVLVDALSETAQRAGGHIEVGRRANAVEQSGSKVRAVRLSDGTMIETSQVVIAADPDLAAELLGPGAPAEIAAWAKQRIPARVSVLDLALAKLPNPKHKVVLGVDAPVYFSVHSAAARLAPAGMELAVLARYLAPGEDGKHSEPELERLADLAQPGWRAHLVERRFLPSLEVTHDTPLAARGGFAGRPGPKIPGIEGAYVIGDWVGPRGMLSDAALASAEQAASMICAEALTRTAA